ncbi:MAG: Ldh family oxidoreductase [Planctomycetota bacterium]|jgi:LDH2 family malate/lactate/ureidoglycolate dehydrogenase|nr:Ldh family oxidoreductase [Planctomycetota bacterium]
MATVDSGIFVGPGALGAWAKNILIKVGVGDADAGVVADSLLAANLRGVDSHGITRMLGVYVKRLELGLMNPVSRFDIVRERAATALVDCHNGIGQLGARFAMEKTIEKAKRSGAAFVATAHSNHYGAAAYWAMMALEHGMIGFSSVNAPAAVAPAGGRQPMFGTNPFAVAVPAGRDIPFVLDMATTLVARGRVILHAKQNKPLEPGWAFDSLGRPTTDPQAALKGLLAPMGGYKGYGIAFAVDILSGVLTGSNFGRHFPGMLAENFETPTDVGGIFAAIDIESFMDRAEFAARMERAFAEVRGCAKANGVERIYTPGEIEHEKAGERARTGIPMPVEIHQEYVELGERLGVPFPKA